MLEWLYPSGAEQPMFDFLEGTINSSVLALVTEGRAEKIPRDSLLEIDSEIILVRGGTAPNVDLAERGHLGSVSAAHTDAAIIRIDPTFTRHAALGAVRAIMGRFFAWGLYVRATSTANTYTSRTTINLPTGAKDVLSVIVRDSTANETYSRLHTKGKDYVVYKEFTPPKIHLRSGGAEGRDMTIVYKKEFVLPSLETEDLTTLGVSDTLQEGLSMAVAGHILRGREVPRVILDRISQQLEAQNIPVSAALNIGEALLGTFRRDFVMAERRRQAELDEPSFEWVRS